MFWVNTLRNWLSTCSCTHPTKHRIRKIAGHHITLIPGILKITGLEASKTPINVASNFEGPMGQLPLDEHV